MNKHWVGLLHEDYLIYDRSLQIPNGPHIFLWSKTSQEMGAYTADIVRGQIVPAIDHEIVDDCLTQYATWQAAYGKSWFAEEERYYQDRAKGEAEEREARLRIEEAVILSRLSLQERHKAQITRIGGEYQGVRKSTRAEKAVRSTGCYACKANLDSAIEWECISCSWILCNCGACGCGYPFRLAATTDHL